MSGFEGDVSLEESGGDYSIDQSSVEPSLGANSTITSSNNSGSNGFAAAIPSGLADYSDTIIVTLIVIGSAFAVYFIIHYFLSKSALSQNLDKKQIKGMIQLLN